MSTQIVKWNYIICLTRSHVYNSEVELYWIAKLFYIILVVNWFVERMWIICGTCLFSCNFFFKFRVSRTSSRESLITVPFYIYHKLSWQVNNVSAVPLPAHFTFLPSTFMIKVDVIYLHVKTIPLPLQSTVI